MTRSIYVVKSEPGPVKIGIATKPRNRFSELQTASHLPLSLEYIGECPEAAAAERIEARAHAILRSQHCRGEWFSVSAEEAVEAVMQAATELGYELRRQIVVKRRPNEIVRDRTLVADLAQEIGVSARWLPTRIRFTGRLLVRAECKVRGVLPPKMGRPRKPDAATTLVPIQLSKATVKRLDRWAKGSGIGSRSGAARALIESGLAAEATIETAIENDALKKLTERIDKHAESRGETRSEVMRRFLEAGLVAEAGEGKPKRRPK
jgi:metal-responsive CopG/Arc/MetJ family transcriptional regulator